MIEKPTEPKIDEKGEELRAHEDLQMPPIGDLLGWGPRSPTPGQIHGFRLPTVGEIRAWFNSLTAMKRTGAVSVRQGTDAAQKKPQTPSTPKP